MTISELKQKRAALIEEVRIIQTRHAQGQGRSSDAGVIEAIEADITQLESSATQIASARRASSRTEALAVLTSASSRQVEAFRTFLATGEKRDLSADIATEGGNIIPPQEFVSEVLRLLTDLVFVRSLATVRTLKNAAALGIPTVAGDGDGDDVPWSTEVQTVGNDTSLAFGKRVMAPNLLAKLIKVSIKLLTSSTLPADVIVADALAAKFARTEEFAFMVGSGAGQPLGLFTASDAGISTGRDLSADNTATAITGDNLVAQTYNIKGQYLPKAVWVFHRDAIKQIRLLKTGITGDKSYIFKPSEMEGQPDLLLGKPVYTSEFAPNTFTTGLYVGLFGDLSRYWIVDQLQMDVQRLDELYTFTSQIGFIGRRLVDGAPADEAAFSRVKLG